MSDPLREDQWATWMRAAIAGDAGAYRLFLQAVTPHLRAMARRRGALFGGSADDAEDVVQEVLLAIHLKRGSWDPSRPIGPWISVIVRNKMIDALRRRGRHVDVPIEDVIDTLAAEAPPDGLEQRDVDRLLSRLQDRQRDIVRSISVEGGSVRETAGRLGMTEGAVRVALHRALKALAALYRSEPE
ncbi:sigma-70 family RNA polymerase sigma factor [Inquilinus sp. NPDC058860]|uniref:sigma-70 family RNA polymerase sigma factor n=1 Tax=Inquilinus sp. NPDC058860 TaxID=3346652 RepID=UPI0036BA6A6C